MEDILIPKPQVKRGRPRKAVMKESDAREDVEYKPGIILGSLSNYRIEHISKMVDLVPNTVEGIGITYVNKQIIITAPLLGCTGLSLRNWKVGRGGVLLRDVKNECKGLGYEHDKYKILYSDTQNLIIRSIGDNELEFFKTCGIVDGYESSIGHYCIIKEFKPGTSVNAIFNTLCEHDNYWIADYNSKVEEESVEEDNIFNHIVKSSEEDDDMFEDDTDYESLLTDDE